MRSALRSRRLAALVVLVLAAAASIATSPAPTPVATRAVEYQESFELTASTPVAVRRLAVRLSTAEDLVGLEATLAARLEGGFNPGSVRLSIVPDQPENQHIVAMPHRQATPAGAVFFAYQRGYPERASCVELPCARTYRAIAELVDDRFGDDLPSAVDVTLRVAGGVTVSGVAEVPASVTFSLEPVDELHRAVPAAEVASASGPEEVEIGGPDRRGSEIHAVVTLAPDTLPPTPVWPVVPEIVLRVEAGERGEPAGPSGQLRVTVLQPAGSAPGRPQSVYFYAPELPIAVSLQTVGGCVAGVPCTIPVDAELGAQSPGELVAVRWWIEARVRYFDASVAPEDPGVRIDVVSAADRHASRLEECARDPLLVLFEAAERKLISEEQFLDATDRIQKGTFDPSMLEELEDYEQLCEAALDDAARAAASPTPPPSESDPSAPRAEEALPAEPITLGIDTPLFVRDVRLTRNAAAGASDLPSVGYVRIDTTVPGSEPGKVLDATIRVFRLEDGVELVPRAQITSSPIRGLGPQEFDPWVGCEAGKACTVDIRVVLAWWHYGPDVRFPITWVLRAGMVWPGLPSGPESAVVAVERLRSFDTVAGSPTRTARLGAPEIVLTRDGQQETRRVVLRLGDGAWPPELAEVPIPGHALLRVSANGSGAGDKPVVSVDIRPPGPQDRGLGDAVELNGAERTWSFAPFGFCQGRAPCEVEYVLEFERIGRGGSYGPITVGWSIETVLQTFESFSLPPGSGLTIDTAG